MKTSNIHIRSAEIKDIADIMQIERDSFHASIIESQAVFEERISIFHKGFLILEDIDTHKCIGYIASELWHHKEKINAADFTLGHSIQSVHSTEGNALYISSMGILKEYRGAGLGEKLFSALFEHILPLYPNIKYAILIVSADWPAAQNIYKKSGFIEKLVIKDFFKPIGEKSSDGIVMQKQLV